MENIYIHFVIAILVIVGFFTYWGKAAGWYEEGGLIYEWWKNIRGKKDDNNDDKNNENR